MEWVQKYIQNLYMNTVLERINDIRENNNTAQQEFEALLESFSPNILELKITIQLHGDLDLEILKEKGFNKVAFIRIYNQPGIEGEITSINLPTLPTLREFSCSNQLITSFDLAYMPALTKLELKNNQLKRIQMPFADRNKFQTLNFSGNKLTEFTQSVSVSRLILDNNQIKVIDLKHFSNLNTISCLNNPDIRILNVPMTGVDVKLDDNANKQYAMTTPPSLLNPTSLYAPTPISPDLPPPTTMFTRPTIATTAAPAFRRDNAMNIRPTQNVRAAFADKLKPNQIVRPRNSSSPTEHEIQAMKNVNYDDCLNEYFKLKSKYDEKEMELKRSAFDKAPTKSAGKKMAQNAVAPCIKCGRRVGSIFKMEKNRYVALCGSKTTPCELRIELYRGEVEPLPFAIHIYETDVEQMKQQIICEKMNTLFQYQSEAETVSKYKDLLEEFSLSNYYLNELIDHYNVIFHDTHKRELIKSKMENIYTLKRSMQDLASSFETTGSRDTLKMLVNMYTKEYMPEINSLQDLKYNIREMNEIDEEQVMFQFGTSLKHFDVVLREPSVIAFRV